MSSAIFDIFNFVGALAQDFVNFYDTEFVQSFVNLADGASQLIGMFV